MTDSSLMHTGETPPQLRKGHTTADLGPTDSTDSGSDVVGGPGFSAEAWRDRIGNEGNDVESVRATDGASKRFAQGAGPDHGDPELDSDSDRAGTGERAAAGPDTTGPVDQTLFDEEGNAVNGEDIADDSSLDALLQEPEEASSEERDVPDRSTHGGGRVSDVEREDSPADRTRSNWAV